MNISSYNMIVISVALGYHIIPMAVTSPIMKCPYMDDFSYTNTFMRFRKSAVDLYHRE